MGVGVEQGSQCVLTAFSVEDKKCVSYKGCLKGSRVEYWGQA